MVAPVFAADDVPSEDDVNEWFVNSNFKIKTGNTGVTSTSFSDDPDLQHTVLAGATYEVTAQLFHQSPTANDIRIGWTYPVGCTMVWAIHGWQTAAAGSSDDSFGTFAITDTPTSGGVTGSPAPIFARGALIVAGTGGSFRVRFSQASAGGTSSLLAGSFSILRRVS
jgi:hypothetical protein